MGKASFTEEDLKADFILFLHYTWMMLNLPPPTRCQVLMAQWMSNSKVRDRGIQAFRGIGKSYICYAYAVWRIWNNPNINVSTC